MLHCFNSTPLILVINRTKPQLYANCFNFSEPAQAGKNIYQQDSVMNYPISFSGIFLVHILFSIMQMETL